MALTLKAWYSLRIFKAQLRIETMGIWASKALGISPGACDLLILKITEDCSELKTAFCTSNSNFKL